MLHPDRLFHPEPTLRRIARELYEAVAGLPIVSPHGHVDPRLFADPNATFGTPADLFIIPDHYVTRMLYSQGVPLERLGVPRVDGGPVETDHRQVWHLFCAHFHLFRATPSGIWLKHELSEVFGIDETPSAANADRLYDQIAEKLASPEFSPRALFKRFNIEVLATTDAATDTLEHHRAIRASGWDGRIIPTFRPDGVINLDAPGWRQNIEALSAVSGIDVVDYASLIRALEERRQFFRSMGATATDHAVLTPATAELSPREADAILGRALKGQTSAEDAARFAAHMLMEMARMSIEDGLVMQLHPGSLRNHNRFVFERFGPDKGADIPIQAEFTRNLLPLLNRYGNDPRLTLIVFTLDESTYSRELAPLAGHYPALKLGPPWWFLDSPNGIARYFDQVVETAGLYNTVGFNDDTRAFCSIPARHDLWRRASANWVAGLVARHIVEMDEAQEMMAELAVGLARRAYKL
ncbi:MAG: glucuronate isomerase [Thermoflexia bacterium]|nr:MAG: glucuronate isomerase [Thermoflexia bacterium]